MRLRTRKAQLQETRFREAMVITRKFLDHAISKKVGQIRSMEIVRNAPRLLGGRVLHLAEGGMPWTRVVVDEMPDVVFVIYPDSDGNPYQSWRWQTTLDWQLLLNQELLALIPRGLADSLA